MPIEIESPEGFGYEKIDCTLSESSFTDQRLSDLGISINDLLLYYGDHKGKSELREFIASQIGLSPDDILITPGAAPALFILNTALLEKNDHLVIAKTNYATNIETPRAIGCNISLLNLRFEDNYAIDVDEMKDLIKPETKLVSLTYPHNPTGVTISEEVLREIISIIEKKGIFLLLDETYRDMSFQPPLPIAATLSPRVISVTSMSKSYGLPGIRMGWIICKDVKLMETLLAAKEQILITNSVIDEEIAYQYLLSKQKFFPNVRKILLQNFEILKKFMREQSFLEWVEPQGGCVCFPRVKEEININTNKFYDILLNKYSTYVGRGGWFDEDDRYMRIGYGWEKKEKLEKGLGNIIKAIEESGQA